MNKPHSELHFDIGPVILKYWPVITALGILTMSYGITDQKLKEIEPLKQDVKTMTIMVAKLDERTAMIQRSLDKIETNIQK